MWTELPLTFALTFLICGSRRTDGFLLGKKLPVKNCFKSFSERVTGSLPVNSGGSEIIILYRPGVKGCTDGNCLLVKNTGMVTNSGCQCESDIRRAPHGFDAIRTIHFLRNQLRDADAELERLREALGKISNASLNAWSARRMQSVARAALKQGD